MSAIISNAGANTYAPNVDREKMAEQLGKTQNADTNGQKLVNGSIQGSVKEYEPPKSTNLAYYATNGRDTVELSEPTVFYNVFTDPWNKPDFLSEWETAIINRITAQENYWEEQYVETGEISERVEANLNADMSSLPSKKVWLEKQVTDILGAAGINTKDLGGLKLNLLHGDQNYDTYLTFKVSDGQDNIDSELVAKIEKALNNPEHQTVAHTFSGYLSSVTAVERTLQRYGKYETSEPVFEGYEDFNASDFRTFF